MNQIQCEQVLQACIIGRIGCKYSKSVYIVPISFAFSEGHIYGCSKVGLKIEMMRKHREVCFEVDQVDDLRNWRSVVAWGTYEELSDSREREKAHEVLSTKFNVYQLGDTLKPVFTPAEGLHTKEKRPILYRIKVSEMTGRFEKGSAQ